MVLTDTPRSSPRHSGVALPDPVVIMNIETKNIKIKNKERRNDFMT